MSTVASSVIESTASKVDAAQNIVSNHVGWSVGAGLVPVPFLDLAAIAATQVNMLRQLSSLYGVAFKEDAVKMAIGTLLGSVAPRAVAPAAASLLKFVPVVGSMLSGFTLPAASGAATYALGKVFIQHFESGGTFLDFDPSKVTAYFKSHFDQQSGKGVAAKAA